jgi:penicillin-binding protein 1A
VPLRELPPFLPKAFLAIEDRRFYSHWGSIRLGVARAVAANLLHRGVSQGGSTITQQLAKNLFLTQERTMQRKLQEVILAVWLERKYSKDEILDLYLNRVYFGSGAYGVEAAAQRYFGKSARSVTLAEAALLAGLVKSPSKLAPTRNFEAAERRAQIVLAAMSDAGYVKEEAAKTAMTHRAEDRQAVGRRLEQLRRRLGDGRARRRGRARRGGHRGRDHDRSVAAGAGREGAADESTAKGAKFDVEQGAWSR